MMSYSIVQIFFKGLYLGNEQCLNSNPPPPRYCLHYVSVPVLEMEVLEHVCHWNSHLIRKNKQCETPCCVPDEMHEMPGLYGRYSSLLIGPFTQFLLQAGAIDQMNPFDANLWMLAWHSESELPPPFLPTEFEDWADDILLTDLNIVRHDVTAPHIRNIYIYLSQQEPPSIVFESYS